MSILVTGAAGFIGFYVTQRLLERGERVIGIDNLNDYYDVRLKHARLAQIGEHPNFRFIQLDLADRQGMAELFAAIRREPVTAEELERTRNYIIGKFLIDHQTNLRRAFYLGHYETMGLGMERDERLPALIGAVTAEQVMEAANRYLHEPTIVELLPE